ncbi:MAG: hypothetical protein O2968_12795 [Acidobacteria bacterium]|nr:hypothetical protein [Acidobacteriota bacterium]
MDVEKTIEFILQMQSRQEAHMSELTQRQDDLTTALLKLTENVSGLADIVGEVSRAQARTEEEIRRTEEERRRAEEQNRLAHERFQELNQATDERLHALIKTMDDWIRNQGNRNGAPG